MTLKISPISPGNMRRRASPARRERADDVFAGQLHARSQQRLHAGANEKRRLTRKAEHFETCAVGSLGDAREIHPGGDVLQPHVDERIVVRAMAEVATQRAGDALRVIQVRARQAVVDEQRHTRSSCAARLAIHG